MARAAHRPSDLVGDARDGGACCSRQETGELIALDAETGQQVWQFQTGSGITLNDHLHPQRPQYVTVLSGIGGLWWNVAREQLKGKVPQKAARFWTFRDPAGLNATLLTGAINTSWPGEIPAMTRL